MTYSLRRANADRSRWTVQQAMANVGVSPTPSEYNLTFIR